MTATATKKQTVTREQITALLRAHVAQRSGIDFRNYWTRDHWNAHSEGKKAFMSDYRRIMQQGREARQLLAYVERSTMTTDILLSGFKAYSGRLEITHKKQGPGIEYTTGQYFATEYRAAACAVLARAIFEYWYFSGMNYEQIKKQARQEFGAAITRKWF